MWIHADQKGIEREVWAEYFFEKYPAKLCLFVGLINEILVYVSPFLKIVGRVLIRELFWHIKTYKKQAYF